MTALHGSLYDHRAETPGTCPGEGCGWAGTFVEPYGSLEHRPVWSATTAPQSRQTRPQGGGNNDPSRGWGAGMTRRWTETEYQRLFSRVPPEGRPPEREEVAQLAAEFDRTHDAIRWQWEDGAAYVTGRSASTTSDALKAWLDRRSTGPR